MHFVAYIVSCITVINAILNVTVHSFTELRQVVRAFDNLNYRLAIIPEIGLNTLLNRFIPIGREERNINFCKFFIVFIVYYFVFSLNNFIFYANALVG